MTRQRLGDEIVFAWRDDALDADASRERLSLLRRARLLTRPIARARRHTPR